MPGDTQLLSKAGLSVGDPVLVITPLLAGSLDRPWHGCPVVWFATIGMICDRYLSLLPLSLTYYLYIHELLILDFMYRRPLRRIGLMIIPPTRYISRPSRTYPSVILSPEVELGQDNNFLPTWSPHRDKIEELLCLGTDYAWHNLVYSLICAALAIQCPPLCLSTSSSSPHSWPPLFLISIVLCTRYIHSSICLVGFGALVEMR
jgi:hypothetical protein